MAEMYFVALVAPGPIDDEVLQWKRLLQSRFDCQAAPRSPAHITLVPPFWMDESLERRLCDDIELFSNSRSPFDVYLKDFSTFRPRVIFIEVTPSESLSTLHLKLNTFLQKDRLFPVVADERPFHPHVTIATRDLHKKAFQEAWEIFDRKKYEASWSAAGISILKHDKKKWEVIFTSHFNKLIGID